MPGNLLFANMSFPSLSGDDREDIKRLTNHVYMLQEELRYTMGNIGMDNFNQAELKTLSSHIVDGASIAELRAAVDADSANIDLLAAYTGASIAELRAAVDADSANIDLLAAYTGMADVEEVDAPEDFTDITKTYKIGTNYYRYNGTEWVDDTSISSASLALAAINGQSSASLKADRIDFTGFTTFLTADDVGEDGTTVIDGGRISTGTLYTDVLAKLDDGSGTPYIAMQNGFDFRNAEQMNFEQSSYTPYSRAVQGLYALAFNGDTVLDGLGRGTSGNEPTPVVGYIQNYQSLTGTVTQYGMEIGAAHNLYLYGQAGGDTSMGAGVEIDSVKPSAVATNGIYFSLQVVDAGVYAIKYRKESNGTFTQLDIATILS